MNTGAMSHRVSKSYKDNPEYEVKLQPFHGRLRVIFAGEAIVDTKGAFVLHETRHAPVYYFPLSDVRDGILEPSDHMTHCPFKGDASYWSLKVGEVFSRDAVWSYQDPLPEVPELADLVSFFPERLDEVIVDDGD